MITVRWRAQLRRAAMLLGGVAVPVGWLLAMPAAAMPAATPAAGAPHTVTVGDVAEAWYSASPVDVCSTPLGCPPDQAPTSPYPADTLHVGVAGGHETARTYLLPDLSLVPYGDKLLTAVMTIPVATGSTDGTAAPDSARLLACLVTEPFTDGQQGSTQTPPKTDCTTAAAASYDAKKSVFTVDLGPIAQVWSNGQLPLGVALVPDPKATQPTDAWHVTSNGRKRQGVPHVQTVVTYTTSDSSPPLGSTSVSSGAGTTSTSAPAPVSMPPAQLPPPSTGTQPVTPPVVAGQPPAATLARPVAFARGAPPAIAFVAPLLLLAGGIFFARVFTRDATPLAVRT
jgi:hypothetical protein